MYKMEEMPIVTGKRRNEGGNKEGGTPPPLIENHMAATSLLNYVLYDISMCAISFHFGTEE